jgi:phage regulator Rha-like protein
VNFRISQNRRAAEQIRAMITENNRLVESLDQEIHAEEGRTGVSDPTHFTYSTVAKAAMSRRNNLLRSIETLGLQLQQVEYALAEAMAAATPASTADHCLHLSKSDAA